MHKRTKPLRWRSHRVALLFLPVIAIFYWKFTLSGQYELMWAPDQATQVLPWIHVASRQWRSGTAPLWDPHLWGGQPLLGQAQPGVAYFLNWILYSIPAKNGYLNSDILHWYYVVIHTMAAAFCFALCRDLRRSIPASFVAGLIYSLTGYLAVTDWPQMMNGAVWAPLVFLYLLRSVEGRNPVQSAALSGLFLGLSWLSGHHQIPLFLSLASIVTWCAHAVGKQRINLLVLRHALIAFAICGLVGALQILPAREYGMNAVRWVGAPNPVGWSDKVPYSSHESGAMQPASLIGIVLPGMATISEPFIGFAAFTLAMLAVAASQGRHVRIFATLGVCSFLYALGSNTPLEGIVYALVPMVEKARTPGAAIFLFTLAASVLCSFGLDLLGRHASRHYVRLVVRFLLWTGVGLVLGVLVLTVSKVGPDQRLARGAVYVFLLTGLLIATHRRVFRLRTSMVLIGVLVLLEAGGVTHTPADKKGNMMTYLDSIRLNRDLADYLAKQHPPFRIALAGDAIPGNWAAYHGLDSMSGYLASLSTNLTTVAAHNRQVQLLWGARYLMAEQPQTPEDVDVFTGQSGRKLFVRKDAFQRSWIVHRVEKTESRKRINEIVQADLPSFAERALMTTDPPVVDSCVGHEEAASYKRPSADTVVVTAKLACKGLIIVSDTFFPGWKADVDGTDVEIYEVNGAMRAVVAPEGEHKITMRYRPASVYIGAVLTVVGLLAAFGISYIQRMLTSRGTGPR